MSTFSKITTSKHLAVAAGEFTHVPTPTPQVTLQLSGLRKTPPHMATANHSEIRSVALAPPTQPAVTTVLDVGKRLVHLVNASEHNTAAALWSVAGEMLKDVHPQLKTGALLMRANYLDKADAQLVKAQAHGAITDPTHIQGAADVANYAVSLVAQSAVPLVTTVVAARTLGAPAALLSAQVFNTAFNTHYQIHSTGEANLHQAAAAALPVSAVQVATGGLFARSPFAAWPVWGAAGGVTTVGGQHLSTVGANVMPGTESSYGQGAFDGLLMGSLLGPLVATARPLRSFKANNPLQLERNAAPKQVNKNDVIDLPPGSWSRVHEGALASRTQVSTSPLSTAIQAASFPSSARTHPAPQPTMKDRGYSIAGRGIGTYHFPDTVNDGWVGGNRAHSTTSTQEVSFSAARKTRGGTALRTHVVDILLSASPQTRSTLLRFAKKQPARPHYAATLGGGKAADLVRSAKTKIAQLGTTPEQLGKFLDRAFGRKRGAAELEALVINPLAWGAKHKPLPALEMKDLNVLNRTEVNVLGLMQAGLSQEQIADHLNRSYKSVRNVRSDALRKLGARSLEEVQWRFTLDDHESASGPKVLAQGLRRRRAALLWDRQPHLLNQQTDALLAASPEVLAELRAYVLHFETAPVENIAPALSYVPNDITAFQKIKTQIFDNQKKTMADPLTWLEPWRGPDETISNMLQGLSENKTAWQRERSLIKEINPNNIQTLRGQAFKVLELLAHHHSEVEIATQLGLTPDKVQQLIVRILAVYRAKTWPDLVQRYGGEHTALSQDIEQEKIRRRSQKSGPSSIKKITTPSHLLSTSEVVNVLSSRKPEVREALLYVAQGATVTEAAAAMNADRSNTSKAVHSALKLLRTTRWGLVDQLDAAFGAGHGVLELSDLVIRPTQWTEKWRPAKYDILTLIGLSLTEAKVLRFSQTGASQEEIAEALGIAHKTVRNSLSLALKRVGVKNLHELELHFVSGQGESALTGAEALTKVLSALETQLSGQPPVPLERLHQTRQNP